MAEQRSGEAAPFAVGERVRVRDDHPTHPGLEGVVTGIAENTLGHLVYVRDTTGATSPWARESLERDSRSETVVPEMRWQQRVLREQGMCAKLVVENEIQKACILPRPCVIHGDWTSDGDRPETVVRRCEAETTVRDDEHKTYRCLLPTGHAGSHESGDITVEWTDETTRPRVVPDSPDERFMQGCAHYVDEWRDDAAEAWHGAGHIRAMVQEEHRRESGGACSAIEACIERLEKRAADYRYQAERILEEDTADAEAADVEAEEMQLSSAVAEQCANDLRSMLREEHRREIATLPPELLAAAAEVVLAGVRWVEARTKARRPLVKTAVWQAHRDAEAALIRAIRGVGYVDAPPCAGADYTASPPLTGREVGSDREAEPPTKSTEPAARAVGVNGPAGVNADRQGVTAGETAPVPSSGAPSDDDWTAKDGRSNCSDLYIDIVEDVARMVRSARVGDAPSGVARTIVSRLAHVHGLTPRPAQAQTGKKKR